MSWNSVTSKGQNGSLSIIQGLSTGNTAPDTP